MTLKFHHYQKSYANQLLRGVDISPRTWLLQDIARQHADQFKSLLDIGCGNAYKTLMLANDFGKVIGLEPSPDMLTLAASNIKNHQPSNLQLVKGVSESLPFLQHQFDVITAILTWWNAKEVHRMIKPGGVFLCESLGPEDKTTLTKFFGKDNLGWRGANLNTHLEAIKNEMRQLLYPFFGSIEFHNIAWKTAYSAEGLLLLLKNTKSTVRDFCENKDAALFKTAIEALASNGEIVLTQNRLITVAKNPIKPK